MVGFIYLLCFFEGMKDKISITINEKILRDIDSVVDNIFIRNRSQAIEYFIKQAMKETKTAVILAGVRGKGLAGSKFPKRYAFKINGQTIIEKQIKKLKDSGFKKIYIVANHNTLTDIFRIIGDCANSDLKIEFIDEEDQDGAGAALKLLTGKIKTTFLVVQCDVVLDNVDLMELWKQHMEDKMVVTLRVCGSITPSNTCLFGHVNMEGRKVISYDEKPAPKRVSSSLFFGGVFVAEPEFFHYPGKSLEYDIFPELAKRRLLGGHITSSAHLHVHTKEDLMNVKRKLNELDL